MTTTIAFMTQGKGLAYMRHAGSELSVATPPRRFVCWMSNLVWHDDEGR